ncbi:hypothetical protein ACWKSP_13280 [Micromonosporaceae bacterium Da 78-11]
MSIFDGSVAAAPPDAVAGRRAVVAALSGEEFALGPVGAGAGATTGKWRDRQDPGGLGVAQASAGPASVVAVAVVNAWGDVLGVDGRPFVEPGAGPVGRHPPLRLSRGVYQGFLRRRRVAGPVPTAWPAATVSAVGGAGKCRTRALDCRYDLHRR